MRRLLPLLLLPLLLLPGACADLTVTDVLRASVLLPPLGPSMEPPEPLDPPPSAMAEEAEALPDAPTILVTVGSRRVVAALFQHSGEQRMWRSGDGLVVATDGARVVATAGTRTWLGATRFDGPDPLDDPGALAARPASARRLVDVMSSSRDPGKMRFGVPLECRLRAYGTEAGLLVEERCGGGASFTNRFWADPETGAVFRSEQWVGEDDRPMTVEVLSSPAS